LRREDLDSDPISQFQRWLKEALEAQLPEPNAMVVASVDETGQPWTRTLLLKVCDEQGFTFFTNYESAKARHFMREPRCAITFLWLGLQRQVQVIGRVGPTGREESERYFASRPITSQLGAWASRQSEVIENREILEHQLEEARSRFGDTSIPCPPNWGGYRLAPDSIEFWQGRESRLHDRFRYVRVVEKGWDVQRLSP
jgi:pyridoxamine 5'-phosphate oxidase